MILGEEAEVVAYCVVDYCWKLNETTAVSESSKLPSNSVHPQRSFTTDVFGGVYFHIRVNISSYSNVVIIHFLSLKDAFKGPKTCMPLFCLLTGVCSSMWSEFVSGGFQQSRCVVFTFTVSFFFGWKTSNHNASKFQRRRRKTIQFQVCHLFWVQFFFFKDRRRFVKTVAVP